MADAKVPPEAGDAQSTSARRQTLRLSDAEGVAAARLDMFGDPLLKDSLAGAATSPGDGAASSSAEEAPAETSRPAAAAADGIQLVVPDLPPFDLPPPVPVPASDARKPLDAGSGGGETDRHPPSASGHPTVLVPPAPRFDTPSSGKTPGTEPDSAGAAPAAHLEDPPTLGAPDTADAAVEEAPQEERNGAAVESGPFGVPFMMPPGTPEHERLGDMSAGPMNERPRFRDELVFVKEAASDHEPPPSRDELTFVEEVARDAIVSDATAPPDAGPLPPTELPQDPPFIEASAPPPPEDPPGASTFSAFPETSSAFPDPSPYPEEDPELRFREAPPEAPEPALHPPAPFLDAAAKIAAEANATAEALDNLERMLAQKLPPVPAVEPAYRPDHYGDRLAPPAPRPDTLRLRMQGLEPEPPSFALHEPAPLLPLPMPTQRSRRSVYMLGFLTGLALSLMAGAVLFFFILHAGAG